MSHPLVLALFADATAAASAGRELRGLGIPREAISIVARTHDDEGALAQQSGGSPGSEIEDSRPAGRLGELGAHLLAAIALVMPGIGPIVADGPLAAGLGEAAGHLGGGLKRTLERAGLDHANAQQWVDRIHQGDVLVGVHVDATAVDAVRDVLVRNGGRHLAVGVWTE
ncbi:MAG TPA: hypothetical protein VIX63_06705 [Vicinamibacterales bacterium]